MTHPAPGGEPAGHPYQVFAAQTRGPCQERALVLKALGLPFEMFHDGSLWQLVVPPPYTGQALQELSSYEVENVDWPPPRPPVPMLSNGKRGALLYALFLIISHPIGQNGLFGINFWAAGRMDAIAVNGGALWRTVTALSLHGDIAHLAGNIAFGAAFGALASHTLGGGLAWLGMLLAGALGNYINALVLVPRFKEQHLSIGASTAVFATLGLMAAYEWMRRRDFALTPMRRFAPLLGAAALLGFVGMGGAPEPGQPGSTPKIDIGAHVFGFGAGVGLGIVFGFLRLPDRLSSRGQLVLAWCVPIVMALAWALAIRA